MSRVIYALLVGIDEYPNPRHRLYGCVNDVRAIETYLREQVAEQPEFKLNARALLNDKARREDIVSGFRDHLSQAGAGDVVLFYFSGHGSQERAPVEFWHLEPDRLDETLVCWDSRTIGGWDLADKELSKLISELADRQPHVAVVLDCCHSGSGTRAPLQDTAVRRIPADRRQRPLESFLSSVEEAEALASSRSVNNRPTGWKFAGRHVLLAACRDHQEAREYHGGGQARGAFSFFLVDTLQKSGGPVTYRELFARTNALVRSRVDDQSPQLESIDHARLDTVFLDGAVSGSAPTFTISHDQTEGWVVDAGAAHGFPEPTASETIVLSVFPFASRADQLAAEANAIGIAEVSEVMPVRSRVRLQGVDTLASNQVFKGIISTLPLPRLGVRLEGNEEGVKFARQAIATARRGRDASLYICEVTDSIPTRFRLIALNEGYWITRPESDRAVVQEVKGYNETSAKLAITRLEHIAKWTTVSELGNPASGLSQHELQMSITKDGNELTGREIRLEYRYDMESRKWVQPSFQVALTNCGSRALYCALLALSESFEITAELLENRCERLESGQHIQVTVYPRVNKEAWQTGVTETRDTLKLIVSTDDFDPQVMEQSELPAGEELPRPGTTRKAKSTALKSRLGRLFERVQTRTLGAEPEADEVNSDWLTSEVTISTVRPLNSAAVSSRDSNALGVGVNVLPHPALKARMRLTTAPQAARDLGNLLVPPLLREDLEVTPPFQFTASRGSDSGLSVLGLSEVEDHTVVTPDRPLTLTVPSQLAEDSHVLPVGFDGEFFLPLGKAVRHAGHTEIVLQRLPQPTSHGKKSLHGSIRILFQKVIASKLGVPYDYPHLAIAEIGQDSNVSYEHDADCIRDRVTRARRILLLIHGIIGDTRGMAASIRLGNGSEEPLASLYDVVLTFDYENINTSIQETAQALKQRLAAVGLGAGHGKSLHIVAHSMGGLVARWFIEHEQGNQVVRHLVMAGTPNGGSPWPTVQDWATTALAIGLNSMSTMSWPVKLLGDLMLGVETIDVTLDQMKPESEFLKSLATGPDPSLPYTLLAGNTSITSAAVEPRPDDESSWIRRLLSRVASPNLLHVLTSPAFLGTPNDIAVAVSSMKAIPPDRSKGMDVYEVACDHLSYFSDINGIESLSDVLLRLE